MLSSYLLAPTAVVLLIAAVMAARITLNEWRQR